LERRNDQSSFTFRIGVRRRMIVVEQHVGLGELRDVDGIAFGANQFGRSQP
jgi:hypothetical protein